MVARSLHHSTDYSKNHCISLCLEWIVLTGLYTNASLLSSIKTSVVPLESGNTLAIPNNTCTHNIIELVDSINRDGQDVTYTKYITKPKISQKQYTFKTSNLHHHVL